MSWLWLFPATSIALILFMILSAKPYPKKWEEEENKKLKKKFDEHNKKSQT